MPDLAIPDSPPQTSIEGADPGIVWCDDPAGLMRIGEPAVRVVIWRRAQPAPLAAALAREKFENLPEACLTVAPAAARAALQALFAARPRGLWPLAEDVAGLASHFAAMLGLAKVHIRLERLAHDACSLFHIDFVSARLIKTYIGPTTEYLPEFATDRTGLGLGRNERICRDPRAVRRLPPGAVGVFKGSRGAAGPAGAAVHRSPPVEADGAVRYVLVIDDAAAIAPPAISRASGCR